MAFPTLLIHHLPTKFAELPGWVSWVVGRIILGFSVVIVITLVVFAATQILPSDPARVILGPEATLEAVETLRRQLGLDKPFIVQYASWIANVAVGDFGVSLDSGVRTAEIVGSRLDNSMALLLYVLAVTIPLSLWLGTVLAIHRDSKFDRTVMTSLILIKAIPSFVVGLALIMIFAVILLPVLPAVSLLDPTRPAFLQVSYLILPAATLILSVTPYLTRLVRSSVIEVLDSDYIAAARLRGLSEVVIIRRHVLPNALIPAIQGIALTARVLFGGVLVVEVVFSYPGLGDALNSAIQMRDLPVIQMIAMVTAIAVVLINLTADIFTVLLTPKLRTAHQPTLRPGTRAAIKMKAGL